MQKDQRFSHNAYINTYVAFVPIISTDDLLHYIFSLKLIMPLYDILRQIFGINVALDILKTT